MKKKLVLPRESLANLTLTQPGSWNPIPSPQLRELEGGAAIQYAPSITPVSIVSVDGSAISLATLIGTCFCNSQQVCWTPQCGAQGGVHLRV